MHVQLGPMIVRHLSAKFFLFHKDGVASLQTSVNEASHSNYVRICRTITGPDVCEQVAGRFKTSLRNFSELNNLTEFGVVLIVSAAENSLGIRCHANDGPSA